MTSNETVSGPPVVDPVILERRDGDQHQVPIQLLDLRGGPTEPIRVRVVDIEVPLGPEGGERSPGSAPAWLERVETDGVELAVALSLADRGWTLELSVYGEDSEPLVGEPVMLQLDDTLLLDGDEAHATDGEGELRLEVGAGEALDIWLPERPGAALALRLRPPEEAHTLAILIQAEEGGGRLTIPELGIERRWIGGLEALEEALVLVLQDEIEERGRVLSARQVARGLQRRGFVLTHCKGSHKQFRGKDGQRVTVPFHEGDLKSGTLCSILRQAGLSYEDLIG
ncbi:MAG: type II toxin-antitoxin system HicA family toxin [Pseudomonadota bacterium]